MFFIRTAFWLAIIVMLLPSDTGGQRQVFGLARAAVTDLGGFCERNPNVCEGTGSVIERFGDKAKFGAKLLLDFAGFGSGSKEIPDEDQASRKSSWPSSFFNMQWLGTDRSREGVATSVNTLRKNDIRPAWSVPGSGLGV